MKLKRVKEVALDETKLTDFFRSTPVGEQSVAYCENLREFRSATTTAYSVRSERREDRNKLKISLDSINQTVTVSLTK